MLVNAENLARLAHKGQVYGDGADYVDAHVAKVAALVAELGGNREQVVGAWLHDVVEDGDVSLDEIYREFGWYVGGIVGACSGFGENRAQRNAAIYSKIAMRPEAALVKVADRIANVEASGVGSKYLAKYLAERDEFDERVAKLAPAAARERLEAAFNLKELA